MNLVNNILNKPRLPEHVTENEFSILSSSSHNLGKPWYWDSLHIDELRDTIVPSVRTQIAVLDTGINFLHPSLEDATIIPHRAFGIEYTYGNHGTGVASLIAGQNQDIGFSGIDPYCAIHSIPVIKPSGFGSLRAVRRGVEIAIDVGVDIINMSVGTPRRDHKLYRLIDKALGDGILIIAAAGNAGFLGGVMHPAKHPGVLAVGAHDRTGLVSSFSSTGSLGDIDILAPGEHIRMAANALSYQDNSGTSFAAPIVTGIASLLKKKGLDVTMETFLNSARDAYQEGEDNKSGFGILSTDEFI